MRKRSKLKIQHKINLWITSAGLLITFVLAGFILYESFEISYEMMDEDIHAAVKADFHQATGRAKENHRELFEELLDFDDTYWIKVFDEQMNLVYKSKLAGLVEIPYHEYKDENEDEIENEGYLFKLTIPEAMKKINKGYDSVVPFRVNLVDVKLDGKAYQVQIAKDSLAIEEEIEELIWIVLVGFLMASGLLIILSYIITGRIIAPIANINRLAKTYKPNQLDRRIPLGENRDELYILSESLNKMFDRLEQAFESQKQLTADTAHELKTPISILMLFIDQSSTREDLPADYIQALMVQADIVRRMNRTVKQLLELSLLDFKEHLNLEQVNIESLIGIVLNDFEIAFEAKNIRVISDIHKIHTLTGDREKLLLLLINLIDNAVKYNRDKGEIRIKLIKEKNEIRLSVWNTGIGIPQKDQSDVFDTFFRVDKSRSQKYGGSGLGLTIVKKIAQLHGGTAYVESTPNEWCRTTIVLPIRDREN